MTPCVCVKCGEFVSLHQCKGHGGNRRHLICYECWNKGHRPNVVREPGSSALRAKAWASVLLAKRMGLLRPQPCVVCDSRHKLTAHHHDYTKPLDIIWACDYCHKQHHAGLLNLSHYQKGNPNER